jgi:pyridoxine 4-dehydrogenase
VARIDPAVPLADQFGALRLLQDQGKVRHVGLSEVSVGQLAEAQSITPIVSVQNRYNLTDRASDDVLRYCEQHAIAFIPWLPVAPITTASAAGPLTAVGRRLGATPTQVALAWLLRHSPNMVPIPGTTSRAHLEENVAAATLSLSPRRLRPARQDLILHADAAAAAYHRPSCRHPTVASARSKPVRFRRAGSRQPGRSR